MSLRETVEKSKKWYLEKYECLDWHFFDEGIVFAIGDYFGSMGEFTDEDMNYARKEGLLEELEYVKNFSETSEDDP